MTAQSGVTFPSDSSSATGRKAISDGLAEADPVGSRAAANETNWRRGYLDHFRRALEAGIGDAGHAHSIAAAGLASLHREFRYASEASGAQGLSEAVDSADSAVSLGSATIKGAGHAETELSLPYRGERLRGLALLDQLDDWTTRGVVTHSCADAVRTVADNPEWLRLAGKKVVVLGAAAEMSPLQALLRWGAEVVAVDLPRPELQSRIDQLATNGAGVVHLPVRHASTSPAGTGADLIHELPDLARWIEELDGDLVLGNYCYADGATHVRVSMAGDAIAEHLLAARPGTALAFLATPTDVFAVPAEEVQRANADYAKRGVAKVIRRPLRLLSRGSLLQRNYPPGADPGICDALVPQQGPNYALAKRIHRWRATAARQSGATVSMNVAPATRTRSVVKNKALAAAYAGAHRFGVEVFDPATSNTLMAALLVHDLQTGAPALAEPWMDEANLAAHGGLWTTGYHPRSALGLAAVLGIGGIRG